MKEVQIRRRESKSHLPPPIVAESIKTIGSVFNGQAPLRGVDGEEEERLLGSLLGTNEKDPSFASKLQNWWIDLRVKVPGEGVVLNITTKERKVGGETIQEPVNIRDYLIYKWALRHMYVAKNKEHLDNDSTKQFYIYDPDVETERTNKSVKVKRDAYKEFIKISEKLEKMKMVAKVMSDVDIESMSPTQIENQMEQLIEDDAAKFLRISTDKHLETKFLIFELISENIIRKVGNLVYFMEEKLGNDIDEAVLFLNDKKNSETVAHLKAKLQDAKK